MRNTLKIGDVFSLPYVVPVEKTIVHLYPVKWTPLSRQNFELS